MSMTQTRINGMSNADRLDPDIYDDGYLSVEHENYYIACAGHSLKLARTEFLIISRLARSSGRIVTAEELWDHAWGSSKPLNSESLHVYIYRLRNKLAPFKIQIDTMVNVGYRLIANPENQGIHTEFR
jgi:DNA-binding response OmpR family regulator